MIRRIGNELKTMYPRKYILICTAAVLFLSFLSATGSRQAGTAGDLIMQVLGGVRSGVNYVSYIKSMPWLIINTLFVGVVLLYCNMEINHRIYMVLSRYSSYTQWWNLKFTSVLLGSMIFSLVSVFVVAAVGCLHNDISFGLTGEYALSSLSWLIPIFTVFCCLIGALLLFCFTWTANMKTCLLVYAISTIVPITMCWVIPDATAWLFGNWGMLKKSNVVDTVYGFSPWLVLAFEVLLIAGLYFFGRSKMILKKICYRVSMQ